MTTAEQIQYDKIKRKNSKVSRGEREEEYFDEQIYINQKQKAKKQIDHERQIKKEKFRQGVSDIIESETV